MKKRFFLGLLVVVTLLACVACNMEMSQDKFDAAYLPSITQEGQYVLISCPAEEDVAIYYTIDGPHTSTITTNSTSFVESNYDPDMNYQTYRIGEAIDVSSQTTWSTKDVEVEFSQIDLVKAYAVVNGRATSVKTYDVIAVNTSISVKAFRLNYLDGQIQLVSEPGADIYYYDDGIVTTGDNISFKGFVLYTEPFTQVGNVWVYAKKNGAMTAIKQLDVSDGITVSNKNSLVQYAYETVAVDGGIKLVLTKANNDPAPDDVLYEVWKDEKKITTPNLSNGEYTFTDVGSYVVTVKNEVNSGDPAEADKSLLKISFEVKQSAKPTLETPVLSVADILECLENAEFESPYDNTVDGQTGAIEGVFNACIESKFENVDENTTVGVNKTSWSAIRNVKGEVASEQQVTTWTDFTAPSFLIQEDGSIKLTNAENYTEKTTISYFMYDYVGNSVLVDDEYVYAHFENVEQITKVTKKGYVVAVALLDGCYPKFSITKVENVCSTPVITTSEVEGGIKVTVTASDSDIPYISYDGGLTYTSETTFTYSNVGTYTVEAYARRESYVISEKATKSVTVEQLVVTWTDLVKLSGTDYTFTATPTDGTVVYKTTNTNLKDTYTVEYYAKKDGYVDSEVKHFVINIPKSETLITATDILGGKSVTLSASAVTGAKIYSSKTDGSVVAPTSFTTNTNATISYWVEYPNYADRVETNKVSFNLSQSVDPVEAYYNGLNGHSYDSSKGEYGAKLGDYEIENIAGGVRVTSLNSSLYVGATAATATKLEKSSSTDVTADTNLYIIEVGKKASSGVTISKSKSAIPSATYNVVTNVLTFPNATSYTSLKFKYSFDNGTTWSEEATYTAPVTLTIPEWYVKDADDFYLYMNDNLSVDSTVDKTVLYNKLYDMWKEKYESACEYNLEVQVTEAKTIGEFKNTCSFNPELKGLYAPKAMDFDVTKTTDSYSVRYLGEDITTPSEILYWSTIKEQGTYYSSTSDLKNQEFANGDKIYFYYATGTDKSDILTFTVGEEVNATGVTVAASNVTGGKKITVSGLGLDQYAKITVYRYATSGTDYVSTPTTWCDCGFKATRTSSDLVSSTYMYQGDGYSVDNVNGTAVFQMDITSDSDFDMQSKYVVKVSVYEYGKVVAEDVASTTFEVLPVTPGLTFTEGTTSGSVVQNGVINFNVPAGTTIKSFSAYDALSGTDIQVIDVEEGATSYTLTDIQERGVHTSAGVTFKLTVSAPGYLDKTVELKVCSFTMPEPKYSTESDKYYVSWNISSMSDWTPVEVGGAEGGKDLTLQKGISEYKVEINNTSTYKFYAQRLSSVVGKEHYNAAGTEYYINSEKIDVKYSAE